MKTIRILATVLACGPTAMSINPVAAQNNDILSNFGGDTAEPAQLVSPDTRVPLTTSTVIFQWNPGSQVEMYWFRMGDAPHSGSLIDQSAGLFTSFTVNQVPLDGRKIFVTLYSLVNGEWQYYYYEYSTGNPVLAAQMISPRDGSTFAGSNVTFTWTPVAGAQQYWLYLGTQQYGNNIFSRSAGLSTSFALQNVPANGQPLFVTLWTLVGNQWKTVVFTACPRSASQ